MDKLQQLKGLAMAFAQNGQQPATVAEIIDSNNFSKVKKLLQEVDEKQKELAEDATRDATAATTASS